MISTAEWRRQERISELEDRTTEIPNLNNIKEIRKKM